MDDWLLGFFATSVAISDYANGLIKSQPIIDKLKTIAEGHHATYSHIALNWLINFHGDMVVEIPGATKNSQTEENTGSMNFVLSTEYLNMLDTV